MNNIYTCIFIGLRRTFFTQQKVWNDYSSPGDHIIHFTNADPQGNLEILLLTQYIVYCAVASPKLEIVNVRRSNPFNSQLV